MLDASNVRTARRVDREPAAHYADGHPETPMHEHTVDARTLDYNQDGQAADNTKLP